MNLKWCFPASNGGVASGFNDAGIENFRGDPYKSLGREIIQNSLDAVHDKKMPVKVDFETFTISSADFPGRDELLRSMRNCEQIADEDSNEKARIFFENGIKLLESKKIDFLRIDDSNTIGLQYNHDSPKKGAFYAITKGRGTSLKQNDVASGSYGIGQNAPFAVSELRTVLYSSHYSNGGKPEEVFQGKSILMSHELDGIETQGTGFFGDKKKLQPVFNKRIPKLFRRSEIVEGAPQGTSIFIAGFKDRADWELELTASIITNFFAALNDGSLEVSINNKIKIDKNNLDALFENSTIIEALDKEDRNEFENAKAYYYAYKVADVRESQLPNLGFCKLWLNVKDDNEDVNFPKKIALVRNGMLITDSQKGLQRFSGVKDFVGLFRCENETGNSILRSMEPPRHNSFEPERAIDSKMAKKALKEMKDFIRREVMKAAAKAEGKVSRLDELEKFLPNIDSQETVPGESKNGEQDPEGRQRILLKPVRISPNKIRKGNNTVDVDVPDNPKPPGPIPPPRPTPPQPRPPKPPEKKRFQMGLRNIRFLSQGPDLRKKQIFFTPTEDGVIDLGIQIAGDTEFENIPIIQADDDIQILNGQIRNLSVTANERMSVTVLLEVPHSGALKVNINEIRP